MENKRVTIRIADRGFLLLKHLKQVEVDQLKAVFTYNNPKYFLSKKMGILFNSEPENISTYEMKDEEFVFPRGGLFKVVTLLKKRGYRVAYDIRTNKGKALDKNTFSLKIDLYNHQKGFVRALKDWSQGLVFSGTGTGKTTGLLALIVELNVSTLVVVPNNALKMQWVQRAKRDLGLSEVGFIESTRYSLKPLTIACIQSWRKYVTVDFFNEYFGAIVADEVHLYAANTFYKAVSQTKAHYRFGASASHTRKDQMEFLIDDLFGFRKYDVPVEQVIASNKVLKVHTRVILSKLEADWYGAPYRGRSFDFNKLTTQMIYDQPRMILVLKLVHSMVVKGHQLFLLCKNRDHCRFVQTLLLKMGINTCLLIGGNQKDFDANIEGLKKREYLVGVGTYSMLSTGVDLPQISVAIAVTPCHSNKTLMQQVSGRVSRIFPNKKKAYFYCIFDYHVFGQKGLQQIYDFDKDAQIEEADTLLPLKEKLKALKTKRKSMIHTRKMNGKSNQER